MLGLERNATIGIVCWLISAGLAIRIFFMWTGDSLSVLTKSIISIIGSALLLLICWKPVSAHFSGSGTGRTYISFGSRIESIYGPLHPWIVGKELAFNFSYKNVGTHPAQVRWEASQLYVKQGGYSNQVEASVIEEFKSVALEQKRSAELGKPRTLMMEQGRFLTASGRIATQDDIQKFKDGTQTMFVLAAIGFSDETGDHLVPVCAWLQPLGEGTAPLIWHECTNFNDVM